MFIVLIFPMLSITIMNFLIFFTLRKQEQSSRLFSRLADAASKKRYRARKKINYQVLIISFLTVIHLTFHFQYQISTINLIAFHPYMLKAIKFISAVNATANFFVYCLFGQTFRKVFVKSFFPKRSRRYGRRYRQNIPPIITTVL